MVIYSGYSLLLNASFITYFFTFCNYEVSKGAGQVTTQVRLPGKTPGGDRVCLDFLFLFDQGKRNRRGTKFRSDTMLQKKTVFVQKKTLKKISLFSRNDCTVPFQKFPQNPIFAA